MGVFGFGIGVSGSGGGDFSGGGCVVVFLVVMVVAVVVVVVTIIRVITVLSLATSVRHARTVIWPPTAASLLPTSMAWRWRFVGQRQQSWLFGMPRWFRQRKHRYNWTR